MAFPTAIAASATVTAAIDACANIYCRLFVDNVEMTIRNINKREKFKKKTQIAQNACAC